MSIERKDQTANNLGFPDTAYGVVKVGELAHKGGATGTGSGQTGEYKVEYEFDLADLPASFTSEEDAGLTTLPANAVIRQVDVQVLEAVSGGTNMNIGLSQPDGTVIDADGLVAAYAGTAVGAYHKGTGALVGTSLANPGQVTVGGTRTAGKVRVAIEYGVLNAL